MTTPPAPQESADGALANSAPSAAPSEFVITDAEVPDHTASGDIDEALSSRGPNRTEKLKALAGARPKRERVERPKRERKPMPPAPRGGFVAPLIEMYGFVALAIMPFDAECAMAIMQAAPKAAESLNELSKVNPSVKRVLIMLTQTSAWGAVITAHLPIIIAVSVHHIPAVRESGMGQLLGKVMQATPPEDAAA